MAEATTNTKVGKPDTYILGIYITLLVISVVESYSASSREIKNDLMEPMVRQLTYLAIGVVTMIACSRINYTKYVNYGNVFSLIAIGLMLFAAFFGKNINGAQRAVHLPGFTIQPAELAKVAIVFLLSLVMATNIDHKQGRIKDRGLWISAVIVGMFGSLLVMQGMTNTLLFVLISLSLIIIGKVSGKAFMRAVLLFSVVVAILFGIKSCAEANTLSDPEKAETEQTKQAAKATTPRASTWDARMDRFFERFRTPLYEQEITEKNDQEMYSYMAQAHGGIFGVLPGNSRECSRLPLAFSDYVFSIIVEELGLFGGLFLIGLFFTLPDARRKHRAQVQPRLPSLPRDGNGSDGGASSLLPHGNQHRSVSRVGTATAVDFQRRHVGAGDKHRLRSDAQRKPHGNTDKRRERRAQGEGGTA